MYSRKVIEKKNMIELVQKEHFEAQFLWTRERYSLKVRSWNEIWLPRQLKSEIYKVTEEFKY